MKKNMEALSQPMSQVLNEEEVSSLEKILNIKYSSKREKRFFAIKTVGNSKVVEAKIILEDKKQTYYYPVVGRAFLDETTPSRKEACYLILDYIDIYFDEFFKGDEQVFIPIDWQEHNFEGMVFEIKGQVRNLYQERMADNLMDQNQ